MMIDRGAGVGMRRERDRETERGRDNIFVRKGGKKEKKNPQSFQCQLQHSGNSISCLLIYFPIY